MNHLVYLIRNNINRKIYVGVHSTINIDDGYMGSSKLLKSDIKLYGKENFVKVILENFDTREKAYKHEYEIVNLEWIRDERTYNLNIGGHMPPSGKGKPKSEETRKKMSESLKGNTRSKGYKHTEEAKKKMSESGKRKIFTEEHKKKISDSGKRKIFTEETRKKISESAKGNTRFKDHKHTKETKNKMSDSHKRKYHSEETKKKMSTSRLGKDLWYKGKKKQIIDGKISWI